MADTLTRPAGPGAAAPGAALLEVRGLEAWYGESHVLHGVDIEVREGEVVTLLGRNGAGKTSTLRAIMGLIGRRQGSVRFEGRELIGARSDAIARAGIALCPATPPTILGEVEVDVALCMTVNPGWGGQAYIPSSTAKVRRILEIVGDGPEIEVDGGIDATTAGPAADAGATLFVAGSALFGAKDPAEAYRTIAAAAGCG